MDDVISRLKGRLVVSCQALPDEPLYSSFIMGRMALAAKMGGAGGIRANTVVDIAEIKRTVDLPVIGIIKRDYPDSNVYITPTIGEVHELMSVQPEIIALDATDRRRPGNTSLDELFYSIKKEYPDQLLMADCSTYEECMHADNLGFDFIGTTMVGYTEESRGVKIDADDFALLRKILRDSSHPVICEGNIDTPVKARRVLELGAFCVVVGGAITRPQNITRRFTEEIER